MNNNRMASLLITLIISLVLFSCDDSSSSDKDNRIPADGVYAKLIVGRMVYASAPSVKIDVITALFSAYYDPCMSESDLQPSGVTCNAYTLVWGNDMFKYQEPTNFNGFLSTGVTYTFTVTASSAVPGLTDSIEFPDNEPLITSPDDSASLSGFDVTWSDAAGNGTVQIILLNISNPAGNVTLETADDGTYTFTDADLSALTAGEYYLQIEKYNEEDIDAAGYDSRSVIRARHMCMTMISLE
jgi:hypothetical protein